MAMRYAHHYPEKSLGSRVEALWELTHPVESHKIRHARVAELADALDLGSSGETYRGSNPLSRTTFNFK